MYRVVNYIADHDGYRAWVKTNEPGTADSAPAGAKIEKTGEAPVKVAPILSAVKVQVAPVAASPVAAYVPAPAPLLRKVVQPVIQPDVSYAQVSQEPIVVAPRISAPIISAPRARAFAHHALAYPEFESKVCTEVRRCDDNG